MQINKRIKEFYKEIGWDEPEYGWTIQKELLKSLLHDFSREVVGNDTGTIRDGMIGFTAGDEIRNKLRSEQLERAYKLLEDK